MTDTLKNLKNRISEYFSQKRCSVSGGTAVFLIFNILLIIGFCKFSFYVLKNHRSLIERDTFVKTYVDVQPYASKRKDFSAYPSLNASDKIVPTPFFAKSEETKRSLQAAAQETAPLPVISSSDDRKKTPVIATSVSRPPVIHQAAFSISSQKTPVIKDERNEDRAVPLDTLMASGLTLLNESEETIAFSEALLQEEALPEQKQIVEEHKAPVSVPVIKSETHQKQKTAKKKNDKNATRWVDVAELRRQLNESSQSVVSQEEINRQNIALLDMNNARQVAALDTNTFSDTQQNPAENKQEDLKISTRAKQDSQNPVQKEVSEIIPNETAASLSSSKAQEASREDTPIKTAVVQDIPFAGTAQAPETARKTDSHSFSSENTALAGNSPSLWKVAKVKGVSKNALPVNSEKKIEKTPETNKTPIPETSQVAQSDVIYRNGRPVSNQEKKSLNWLDRQEAAVWTSMSQSDTPSVWSSTAETEPNSFDRAKAFRVADEQPAEKEIVNSAPVRVVGEEANPEAKSKPILLPLGASQKTFEPKTSEPSTPQSQGQTASSNEPSQKEAGENNLMNRFFSLFEKNDAADALPNIGSGDSAENNQDKEEPEKQISEKPLKAQYEIRQTDEPKTKPEEKKIVPTELRLTFKPNSAEMSAQSIKWIKAFGQRAKKDIQNAVEVRMSNTDPDLQNKRFAMIRNTLTGTGMEKVQIIPVITDRTPHTIVLRMVVLPEEGYTEYTTENTGIKERLYYKQW